MSDVELNCGKKKKKRLHIHPADLSGYRLPTVWCRDGRGE